MKLSPETMLLLKSLSNVNQSMKFTKGNTLKTISNNRTIVSQATIKEEFPKNFCIYSLPSFISCLTLSNEPELDFEMEDNAVVIKHPNSTLIYRFCVESVIVTCEKDVKVPPNADLSIVLTKEDISNVMKGASAISANDLIVACKNGKVTLEVSDVKHASNKFMLSPSSTMEFNASDCSFNLFVDNLNLFSGDYEVTFWKSGISHFKNKDVPIEYFIALQGKK